MPEPQVQLETLKTEWTKCRAYEEQKKTLLEVSLLKIEVEATLNRNQDLFGHIETLSTKLREAENELRDKKDVIRLTRNRVEEVEKHIQGYQDEKVRLFVTDQQPVSSTQTGSTFFCFGIDRW
jgi:chromosome segregation ATPase